MKVNIYGLTEATISFNSMGMMLRGKYSSIPEEYEAGSVAYNVVIDNEHQANELRQISDLKLIRVEVLEEEEKEAINLKDIVSSSLVEETVEETVEVITTTEPALEEIEDDVKVSELPPSAIDIQIPLTDQYENSSDAVVMTSSGPRRGKMTHKMNGEIDDTDSRCAASLQAAEDLKTEEERLDDVIDETLLDPSEQMGSKAVLGAGSGKTTTTAMKNNAFGDKPEPNFLDLEVEDDKKTDKSKEVESPFIDLTPDTNSTDEAFLDLDKEEENELGDSFIEY
mgnify:CR=1 FL=1|jgi:hypothetical protein